MLNIFQAVPSKVKTILSSSQDTVSFNGAANTDDTVKFIIDTATPGYFATRYYDTYSAAGWSNSPLIDGNLLANQAIEDAVQTTSSILARYEVENEVKTNLILVNGRPESISVPTLTRSLPAPTGIDISSLVSSKMLSPYTPYTVNTRITKASANDLAKANTPYPEWITQRYLQLPTSLPRSIKSLSQQLTISFGRQLSEYEKVEAIEKYLQNFTYNINGTANLYLALNLPPVCLGSTSTSGTVAIWDSVMVHSPCPALYSNFQGGHCLTHVGTEGRLVSATPCWPASLGASAREPLVDLLDHGFKGLQFTLAEALSGLKFLEILLLELVLGIPANLRVP